MMLSNFLSLRRQGEFFCFFFFFQKALRKDVFFFLYFEWISPPSQSFLLPFIWWHGCNGDGWHMEWGAPGLGHLGAFLGACFYGWLSVPLWRGNATWWLILSQWHGLIRTCIISQWGFFKDCFLPFISKLPFLVNEATPRVILFLAGACLGFLGIVGCNLGLVFWAYSIVDIPTIVAL